MHGLGHTCARFRTEIAPESAPDAAVMSWRNGLRKRFGWYIDCTSLRRQGTFIALSHPLHEETIMTRLAAVADLCVDVIEVLQLQAKQLERLTNHVEQHTTRLRSQNDLPTVVSELSALHQRAKHLQRQIDQALSMQLEGPAL
jgi:hypothetical protein